MTAIIPRIVFITRDTEYEMLLARHATRGQAEFFLHERGQSIDEVEQRHNRQLATLGQVIAAVPGDWRRNQVKRYELDRFLFEPEDLVIAIGQDGLVANTAKYLNGQSVIGINPDPDLYDGILVPFSSTEASQILVAAMHDDVDIQYRTMAQACLDDGQTLFALNELFIGHQSHQAARYRITTSTVEERQSSSGVIVATGTGATGWARSIHRERHDRLNLPAPDDDVVAEGGARLLQRQADHRRGDETLGHIEARGLDQVEHLPDHFWYQRLAVPHAGVPGAHDLARRFRHHCGDIGWFRSNSWSNIRLLSWATCGQ